jgi:quinoprotein relay system zinc metallohydrolase 2
MPAAARRVGRLLPCSARAVVLISATLASLGIAASSAHAQAALPHEALAPGVFHVPGHQAAWGVEHAGHVANLGFVIGTRCIAVIDSGGSPGTGRALLATLREHSALPVCYVINTHVHPDHVLGNVAFLEANGASAPPPVFVGHQRLRAALAARTPFYLNALRRDFAPAEQTDIIPPPTLAVNDRLELDLGGAVLELRAWPTAHTDNDLTVFDRRSATLWLGDLVFIGHLPVLDGKLAGWLAVLPRLRELPATQLVPCHGPVLRNEPAAFEPTLVYLSRLDRDVRAALTQGLTLSETVARLGDAPAAGAPDEPWLLAQHFQRRNVTTAYAELEWSQ